MVMRAKSRRDWLLASSTRRAPDVVPPKVTFAGNVADRSSLPAGCRAAYAVHKVFTAVEWNAHQSHKWAPRGGIRD